MRIPQNLCPPARVRESNSHIHNKPNLLHTHTAVFRFLRGWGWPKISMFSLSGPTVAYHFPTRLVCECESVFCWVGWWGGVERFNAGCVHSVCREHMEIPRRRSRQVTVRTSPPKGPPRRCTNSDRYYRLDAQTKTNILQIVLEEGAGEGWWKGSASRKKASHWLATFHHRRPPPTPVGQRPLTSKSRNIGFCYASTNTTDHRPGSTACAIVHYVYVCVGERERERRRKVVMV